MARQNQPERKENTVDKLTLEELLQIVETLDPKIKKSLFNTHRQDREDLEQEIKLKIIESYEKIAGFSAPNFEEFLEEFLSREHT